MRIFGLTVFTLLMVFASAGDASAQQPQGGQQAQAMDMDQFMARCAQVRKQPSASQTPQSRQMLDQCDQMDRSMGMTPPARR